MGDLVNTRTQNIVNWTIVIFVTVMSTLFAVSTLFPNWLRTVR
jgi:Mn2+/Fe2+ NRAMP family transporter